MKVVCDNCRAVYKVPNTKLKKPVNKATCRGCGHRMLIPRPKPGSDPNERVLVTAVPPTPASPPPRVEGPATKPIDDEPEATLPGRPPAGFPGTPVPVRQRESRGHGSTAVTNPPPTEPSTRRPTPRPAPRKRTPAPVQRKPTPEPTSRQRHEATKPSPRRPSPKPAPKKPEPRQPMVETRRAPTPRPATPRPAKPRQAQMRVETRKTATPRPVSPRTVEGRKAPTPRPAAPRSQSGGGMKIEFRKPGTPKPVDTDPGVLGAGIPLKIKTVPRGPAEETVPTAHPPGPFGPTTEPPKPGIPSTLDTQPEQPSPFGRETPVPVYTPLPAPIREPVFDPSRDMAWAVLGTLCALFGTFLLASIVVVNDDVARTVLSGIGLMFAISGSMTALLILLTGGRGTRPARVFLSMFVSGFFAMALSALAVSTGIAAITLLREAESIEFGAPPPRPPPVPAPTIAGNPSSGNDGSADAAPTSAPTSRPRPTARPRPAPTGAPVPRAVPVPVVRVGDPPPAVPMPAPEAPPEPVAPPTTISPDVVEVMMYNNLGVKKCFVPLFKTGKIPPRVDVRFTIQPTGQVTGATIQQADLAGGEFESCMRAAVMGINFPPFSGSAQTLTFPFVLSR